MKPKKILVTGGAGFIGSNFIRHTLHHTPHQIINVDKLTYAGNLDSLADVSQHDRYQFEQVDIADAAEVSRVFQNHQPDAVMHLAAESHVDRSIDGPANFVQSNIVGTFNLLQSARMYRSRLAAQKSAEFRFHHVTTDEVYGSLKLNDPSFTESTAYDPHSPYAATKASADHLVRAWGRTYGLPVLISSCSNNYGPFQFPEKLIPLTIIKAIYGHEIRVYGDGSNIRDWIHVSDHVEALLVVLENSEPGQTYNLGGNDERTNLEVVSSICQILAEVCPINQNAFLSSGQKSKLKSYEALIQFVPDRPGHDFRYATNTSRIRNELGWSPKVRFESGLRKTVKWYVENQTWWGNLLNEELVRQGLLSGDATSN